MCFPAAIPIAMAVVSAAGAMVSQKLGNDAQNSAAIQNYNQQSRYAERVNAAALQQQSETDSRNRADNLRQAESAADKTRMQILENRRAMSAARASAGTSGMMGMPLNMIEQNYQALIGGISTNLQSFNSQLDQNYFFNSQDTAMRANSTTNQAIPMKPYLQKFGWGNVLSGVLTGLGTGLGAIGGGAWVFGGGGGWGGGGVVRSVPQTHHQPRITPCRLMVTNKFIRTCKGRLKWTDFN